MTDRTKDCIKRYRELTDDEKYDFLLSLDEMGGCETYTIGSQIDDCIKSMENDEEKA